MLTMNAGAGLSSVFSLLHGCKDAAQRRICSGGVRYPDTGQRTGGISPRHNLELLLLLPR